MLELWVQLLTSALTSPCSWNGRCPECGSHAQYHVGKCQAPCLTCERRHLGPCHAYCMAIRPNSAARFLPPGSCRSLPAASGFGIFQFEFRSRKFANHQSPLRGRWNDSVFLPWFRPLPLGLRCAHYTAGGVGAILGMLLIFVVIHYNVWNNDCTRQAGHWGSNKIIYRGKLWRWWRADFFYSILLFIKCIRLNSGSGHWLGLQHYIFRNYLRRRCKCIVLYPRLCS